MDNRPQDQTEDIDLLLLVERALLFFKRYRWIFIVAAVLGIAAGIFFYKIIPISYRSRAVMHSFVLTNPEQIQIVNNWNRLLKQNELKELAKELNCDEKILSRVKEIKAKEVQQVYTTSNPNGFTIDVVTTDNNILDSLLSGFVYGFENNTYIKTRLDVKKDALRELIDKTTSEIRKLDSTKTTLEKIIGGSEKPSSSLIVDGSSINRQLIEMNEKLYSFKENLQFTNAVQVLQPFSKFNKPDGPHLLPWLVIGLFFFLCLAWLYSVINSVNRKLKARKRGLNT